MTLAGKKLTAVSALALSIFALSTVALAEGTRTWDQSKFEDLTKGTTKGIALRSEGGLELAPAFKALATTPSTYIWSTVPLTKPIPKIRISIRLTPSKRPTSRSRFQPRKAVRSTNLRLCMR